MCVCVVCVCVYVCVCVCVCVDRRFSKLKSYKSISLSLLSFIPLFQNHRQRTLPHKRCRVCRFHCHVSRLLPIFLRFFLNWRSDRESVRATERERERERDSMFDDSRLHSLSLFIKLTHTHLEVDTSQQLKMI